MSYPREVIIVGAGPAGVGIAALLRRSAIQDILVVDAHEVGASFTRWPAETRFITPSFFSNPFGQPDLNAITPDSSLALFSGEEHAGGKTYADYLRAVLDEYQIPVLAPAKIISVALSGSGHFILTTDGGEKLETRALVWATGEFQFPDRQVFPGAERCCHYADVASWKDFTKGEYIVIGGYESAVDAAINLLETGSSVKMLTRSAPWSANHIADPSVSLSPYTRERLSKVIKHPRLAIYEDADISAVTKKSGSNDIYKIHANDGRSWTTHHIPILTTGFQHGGGARQLAAFFEWNEDGYPLLTKEDGSTLFPGLYLVGPQVRHASNIYCFIYKFRQRFPVVAKSLARYLGVSPEGIGGWWTLSSEPGCCTDDGCAC